MNYDVIVAGGGLGGLSFLHHYLKMSPPDLRVLVIDQSPKDTNDRTWSFWSSEVPDFHCALRATWEYLGFASDQFTKYERIDPYQYYTIRGLDFYSEVLTEARNIESIEFLQDHVVSISDHGDSVSVLTSHGLFRGKYVVDSITKPANLGSYLCNWQNFLGWEVQAPSAVFDVDRPLLMDFRTSQEEAASFLYLLPFSETSALVEYTQFTPKREFSTVAYTHALSSYIENTLNLYNFRVLHEEQGSIPMTNYPFQRRLGNVFRIGTVGGDTKPTTGYTFVNVQKHAKEIVAAICAKEVVSSKGQSRFRFYDSLLLDIIARFPQAVEPIMSSLFRNQPISRILRFLHEDSTLSEEVSIFSRLPWSPFLKVLIDKNYATSTETDYSDAQRSPELITH